MKNKQFLTLENVKRMLNGTKKQTKFVKSLQLILIKYC
jgi:hypothetical protein